MKQEYIKPDMDITVFSRENIITSSALKSVSDEIRTGSTLKVDGKSGDSVNLLGFIW